MNDKQRTWIWAVGLAVFLVLARLMPYYISNPWWNLAPAAAFAMFAGVRLRGPKLALVPLAAFLASDLLLILPLSRLNPPEPSPTLMSLIAYLGLDPPDPSSTLMTVVAYLGSSFTRVTPVVYLCLGLMVLLGRYLKREESSPLVLGGAALLGSLLFFVVTNFACWALGEGVIVPRTLAGLGQCYVSAVPFFRNTVASDLLFTATFFGLYALAERARAFSSRRQPA